MNAKDIIEKITTEDVKMILKRLGSDCTDKSEEHGHVIFNTVCHGGDSHKLYYYLETKRFHCYTHCGSLSLFDVVMGSKKVSFYESVRFVMELLGIEELSLSSEVSTVDSSEFNFLRRYQQINKPIRTQHNKLNTYSDIVLEMFSDMYYQGWIDEGISIETMKKYNIKYSIYDNAIVIPHYDADGDLVGIRRRSFNTDEVLHGGKYMPMCIEGKWYTHQLQFNLYGLNINKEAIKRQKRIIIVESEKGVMQLDTIYGDDNVAVALSSSNLSNYQRDMIIDLGVEEVVIALDKQYTNIYGNEYKSYMKKVLSIAKKFNVLVNVIMLWDCNNELGYKDSPTDKGKEVFERLYGQKIRLTGGNS